MEHCFPIKTVTRHTATSRGSRVFLGTLRRPQVDLTSLRFRFLAPSQHLRAIVSVLSALLRKCPRLRVLGTTLQPQGKEPGQRDTTKNHGRLGGIRQTPGYLQKQPCHLPEETSVQLLCAASYDIWCRDLDTDQTSIEQTCGRTDQNGKKYAQHHIQR